MTAPGRELPVLLSADEVQERVEALAGRLALELSPNTIAVVLLLGGLWFAADLTRALARRGLVLDVDALWLASYGHARTSSGRCETRVGLQRPVAGRPVLLIDDVADSGATQAEAGRILRQAAAVSVTTAVFARKPWARARAAEPDHIAWEAPGRFLVGYGMDLAAGARTLPHIAAAD